MSALTKADLATALYHQIGLNKTEAKQLVEAFFEEIIHDLSTGHDVRISSFGKFLLRDKKPRPGRNPRTGESVAIDSRRVVTFIAGHKLKRRVENYIGPELHAYVDDDVPNEH